MRYRHCVVDERCRADYRDLMDALRISERERQRKVSAHGIAYQGRLPKPGNVQERLHKRYGMLSKVDAPIIQLITQSAAWAIR